MNELRIDFAALPGPDRTKLLYVHDVVRPAASRDLAAVVYSVAEFAMGWQGGYFALFGGPRSAPRILWCPDRLNCMGFLNCLQWIDRDRYVVVNAYMYNGRSRVELPFLFVDVDAERIAFYPIKDSCNAIIEVQSNGWRIHERHHNRRFACHDGEVIDPGTLDWRGWANLARLKADYWKGVLGKAT
ncbi:MAG: hypothetical protein ACOY3P_00130 [Planctomycetota bacterium]